MLYADSYYWVAKVDLILEKFNDFFSKLKCFMGMFFGNLK